MTLVGGRGPVRDPELFLSKTTVLSTGCWAWLGRRSSNGYSRAHRRGLGETLAHRVSFRLFVGDIPEGYTIDHLCRNRGCVNPEHLEAVPFVENVRRGEAINVVRGRRGTCDLGHPLVLRQNGHRYCRECAVEANRQKYGWSRRVEPERC